MSFLDMGDEIGAEVGVPVVNAGRAALKQAETLVSMGLSHSKKAWPTPAKMRGGRTAADLNVA
jgi:allantoin racemase